MNWSASAQMPKGQVPSWSPTCAEQDKNRTQGNTPIQSRPVG
jgi:hypothetical protein